MLQLSEVGHMVLLSDGSFRLSSVLTRHGDGLNIWRGDGAARWIGYSAVSGILERHSGGGFSAANDPFQEELWDAFDAEF